MCTKTQVVSHVWIVLPTYKKGWVAFFLPLFSLNISHSPVKIKWVSFILGPNDLSPMIDWSIDLDEGVCCASLCLPFNLCFSKALQSCINNSQALTTQNIVLWHKMQEPVSGPKAGLVFVKKLSRSIPPMKRLCVLTIDFVLTSTEDVMDLC